jgi:hypothetical protein
MTPKLQLRLLRDPGTGFDPAVVAGFDDTDVESD